MAHWINKMTPEERQRVVDKRVRTRRRNKRLKAKNAMAPTPPEDPQNLPIVAPRRRVGVPAILPQLTGLTRKIAELGAEEWASGYLAGFSDARNT